MKKMKQRLRLTQNFFRILKLIKKRILNSRAAADAAPQLETSQNMDKTSSSATAFTSADVPAGGEDPLRVTVEPLPALACIIA